MKTDKQRKENQINPEMIAWEAAWTVYVNSREHVYNRAIEYIENEKSYLNSGGRVWSLAEVCSTRTGQLTRAIKALRKLDAAFCDRLRIQDGKEESKALQAEARAVMSGRQMPRKIGE